MSCGNSHHWRALAFAQGGEWRLQPGGVISADRRMTFVPGYQEKANVFLSCVDFWSIAMEMSGTLNFMTFLSHQKKSRLAAFSKSYLKGFPSKGWRLSLDHTNNWKE